jgi:hypothetical protein
LRLNRDQKRANVGWSHPLTSTDADAQSIRQEPCLSRNSNPSQADTAVEGQPVIRHRRSPDGKYTSNRSIEQPSSAPPSRTRDGKSACQSRDSRIARHRKYLDGGGRQLSPNDHQAGLESDSDEWTDSWDEFQETNAAPPPDRAIPRILRRISHREYSHPSVPSRETRYTAPRVAPPINIEDGRQRHIQNHYTDPMYYGHVLPPPQMPPWSRSRPYMNSAPYPYQDRYLPPMPQNFIGGAEVPIPPLRQLYHSTPSYQTERQEMSPSVREIEHSSSHPNFPLTPAPGTPVSANDADPIKIVEEYLEYLRKVKERELLDANRILSWINRRSR